MLKTLVEIIRSEVSGAAALDYVAGIARYHRIQASPGFRAAAGWCAAQLGEAGLAAEVLRYPARFNQSYWGTTLFQEWDCRRATLDLVSPADHGRRLADFRANGQSVIQRSTSTPPGGLTAEVTVVNDADDPASYEGRDVAGKFVFFTGNAQRAYELAVVERGAAGLVTDQMPELPPVRRALELPGATTYTSFWFTAPPERPAVGFVLSPAEGAALRRLLAVAATGGTSSPVLLHAEVEASLYDGEFENVSAVIPGTDALGSGGPAAPGEPAEETLLVAHLCHPKPSANDNASGSGALLEAARALAALIRSGRLPRPRRTMRFLLVPEMTGTYAYLATNETAIGRTVAALNLDMVGENQALTGGPLQLECPPLACPDYTSDLLAAVVDTAAAEGRNFHGTATYPLFMYTRSPFSGGSDHYILSDPTVGIPCPMFIQFPDRFYHTSADTLDKVDPAMLGRVATMSAAYLYFWAAAGPREAAWVAELMAGRFARDLSVLGESEVLRLAEHAASGGRSGDPAGDRGPKAPGDDGFARRLAFLAERKLEGLRALARVMDGAEAGTWFDRLDREIRQAAAREEERVRAAATSLDRAQAAFTVAPSDPAVMGVTGASGAGNPKPAAGPDGSATPAGRWAELAGRVPRRLHRGPVELRAPLAALPKDRREFWAAFSRKHRRGMDLAAQYVYWMDGRRTLAEVVDCLELETGFRDESFAAGYADLLVECGLLALQPAA